MGGGIPLIRPLKQGLAGERIVKLMGIVNGTTNYVLTRMAEEGLSLQDAVAEAQALGYAERDPTADIEGFDAAAKAAILAMIAFDTQVVAGDVYREGIGEITAADIQFAQQLGYVVKLLAIAEAVDGEVSVRVRPLSCPCTISTWPVLESSFKNRRDNSAKGRTLAGSVPAPVSRTRAVPRPSAGACGAPISSAGSSWPMIASTAKNSLSHTSSLASCSAPPALA